MATNPMQRQARNSFLLGMVLTLVISAAIIAFLFIQIKNLKEEINKKKAATVQVYTLSQDVKAGQIITSDMCMAQMVDAATVPAGATNDINSLLNTFSLCDKDGRDIYTDADGTLYMMINQKKVEVKEETNNNVTSYYIANGSNKEYIELSHKTIVAKVALKANTVITGSLISRGKLNTDDVRQMEYNVLSLPTDLIDGDYIDVRFMLPNGQDFIVVSKKEVTIPNIGGAYSTDIVKMNLSEDEILSMSSAIVETYKMDGAKLHVTKYTDAGIQQAASPTYVVNDEVAKLIESDPNIVSEAMTELSSRYNANNGKLKDVRNQQINSALSTYGTEEGYKEKVEESIKSTKEAREEYLQSLTGGAVTE